MGLSAQASDLLARVQALFGAGNVRVTSTSRTASANASIAGASKTSQHLTGDAFDFVVAGMSPDQVQRTIAGSGISFGQSIQEYGAGMGPRNHLGVGTKGQLLTGNNGKYTVTGTVAGLPSTVAGGSALVGTWGDQIKSFGQSIGLGDSLGTISNALGTGLAAPGDALDKLYGGLSLSSWFSRITFGVFAILLIAVALFMLSGKSVADVASKVPPIPV